MYRESNPPPRSDPVDIEQPVALGLAGGLGRPDEAGGCGTSNEPSGVFANLLAHHVDGRWMITMKQRSHGPNRSFPN